MIWPAVTSLRITRAPRPAPAPVSVVLVGCVVLSWTTVGSAQDAPKLIGHASCATATCHGGVLKTGPAWHSSWSVWESKDPHGRAGEVLFDPLSERMITALEPTATDAESRARVLSQRCASCHAPAVAQVALTAAEFSRRAQEGVACEACHGPASNWLTPHTQADWPTLSRQLRYSAQSGMLDTESLASRTDNCARCHVGSRTADGLIRDMNHDMIAAGHPRLDFDMATSLKRLPAHWDTGRDAWAAVAKSNNNETLAAIRDRVLLSAVRLSNERTVRSTANETNDRLGAAAPQPELAEYDCQSCHRSYISDPNRPSRGLPRWQPWYTRGQDLPGVGGDELLWEEDRLKQFLTGSANLLDQRSLQLLPPSQPDEPGRGAR